MKKQTFEVYVSNGFTTLEQTFYTNRYEAEEYVKELTERYKDGYYDEGYDYTFRLEELTMLIREL